MDSGKKTLLALVFVFVTPIIIGTVFFYSSDRLGMGKETVNYGTLITPAFPPKIEGLIQFNGDAKRDETLSNKWTLLYIAPNECDKACQDRLKLIKRIRLLTNEQMRRVRTLVVSRNDVSAQTIKKDYKDSNPDLVFSHTLSDKSPFLTQFPHQEKTPVYLIDPLGNLMMYYSQENPDVKKMIKDLLRLLKYSHLG